LWEPIANTHAGEAIELAVAASTREAAELLSRHPRRVPHLLLLAADVSRFSTDELCAIIDAAIEASVAYFCAWGHCCELAHDLFDETLVGDGLEPPRESPCVMTTWHDNESLAEAVDFAIRQAQPTDDWGVTALPRRLLILGGATNPEAMLDAVHHSLSADPYS
jgi:hypothetical protein